MIPQQLVHFIYYATVHIASRGHGWLSVARVRWPIHRSRPLRRTHDLEIWKAIQTSGADVMRVETRTKEMGEEKNGKETVAEFAC